MIRIREILCPVCMEFRELRTPREIAYGKESIEFWCVCGNVITWHIYFEGIEPQFYSTVKSQDEVKYK